jgi:hypothetical protein
MSSAIGTEAYPVVISIVLFGPREKLDLACEDYSEFR